MATHAITVTGKLACPRHWAIFLSGYLDIDQRLAKRLWAALWPSEYQPLLIKINRILDARSEQAILHFCKAVTPQLLMLLCARVAPEDGEPRDAAVVRAEESVLERVNGQGHWV
jgi:hypothetical protein